MSMLLLGVGGGATATNRYLVRGFSDANYFAGPNNEGPSAIGTMRVIAKMLSVPPASPQKVLVGRIGGDGVGYSLRTSGAAQGLEAWQGSNYTTAISLVSGDIGKWFCIHQVFNSSASTLRIYLNGLLWDEVAASVSVPGINDGFWVGRFQHATGLSASEWGFADIAITPDVLTPTQIATDAETIVASNIVAEDLAGQTYRFNADDLVSATDWVSRTGSLTLTRNGTVIVEAI